MFGWHRLLPHWGHEVFVEQAVCLLRMFDHPCDGGFGSGWRFVDRRHRDDRPPLAWDRRNLLFP